MQLPPYRNTMEGRAHEHCHETAAAKIVAATIHFAHEVFQLRRMLMIADLLANDVHCLTYMI